MENPNPAPTSTAALPPTTSQSNEEGREDANNKKPNVRKRTKTGCLTCRKRRIKCDEGKPTCRNCIKSRRHCDGYNQRVIFKEPIGSLAGPYGSSPFPVGSSAMVDDALSHQQGGGHSSRVPLQAIAPRPPSFDFNQAVHLQQRQENVPYHLHFHEAQYIDASPFHKMDATIFIPPSYTQTPNPLLVANFQPQLSQGLHGQSSDPDFSTFAAEDADLGEASSATGVSDTRMVLHSHPISSTQFETHHPYRGSASRDFAPESGGGTGKASANTLGGAGVPPVTSYPASRSYHLGNVLLPDEQDEDRSMPDSDDDYQDAQDIVAPAMAAETQHRSATQVRTFGAYAGSWAVLAYLDHPHVPAFWHSGLRDVFMHFVNVTGPSITLYEPRAFDQTPPGTETMAGHALWRSTYPHMAVRHPALLQAMLALASLQLAKLQNYTQTAALKHYHLALRRLGKIMRSDLRRKHPSTLAATLMLGYFEVWAADHSKWSQHLWGARILFQEIPLKDMARRCLPTKRWRQMEQHRRHINSYFPSLMSGPLPASTVIDYELLSVLTGSLVTAEDYGDVLPPLDDPSWSHATDKDLANYEIYSDLFWWYCKMDVYQSFLAGTKLFMQYEYWTQCPPRSPISSAGTPFGTYDHLILLLGRLATFSFQDRARKRKLAKSHAGGAAAGSPQMFPGMLPVQGKIRGPTGFDLPREPSPQSDSNEEFDAKGSLQSALSEWESIHQAFQVFQNHLGPEFGKLDSGYGDLQDTPFGPAVQYRSYAIAGLWMNFYMGMINLYRSHPEMPPASLQAAGLQAMKTKDFALEIGRIAAGMALDLSDVVEINTLLAAALIECCFCLFVAGVQYRDTAQREWVVRRMYDISRLTGWQSARQIAAGCESAWIKAYEMQAGPPYARTSLFTFKSIWDNPRQIDTKIRELVPRGPEPIVLATADQAGFALGLLGVEEDLKVLELED